MPIVIYALFLFLIFPGHNNSAKLNSPVIWENTKNWKLYNIRAKGGFSYSSDTLKYFKHVSLNGDTMKVFLHSVTEIPLDKTPVWMGYYISSCQLEDGTMIKIEISQYGGFFYDDREKQYYQLTMSKRQEWLKYLSSRAIELE